MKKGFGSKKPMGGKSSSTVGGTKRATTGTKPMSKTGKKSSSLFSGMKSSNILRIDPTQFKNAAHKTNMLPEDAEISYLTEMLGLKNKKDLNSLMGEFEEEGLDDFLDLIFDQGISTVEDDGTSLTRPIIDLNRKREEISLEDFMGGPPPTNLDESDSDLEEEMLISSKTINSSLSSNINDLKHPSKLVKKKKNTQEQADEEEQELRKISTSLLVEDSDVDFDPNNISEDDDDDDSHMNDDEDSTRGKKKSKQGTDLDFYNDIMNSNPAKQVKIHHSEKNTEPGRTKDGKKLFGLVTGPNRYVPPHIRKRLGITISRSAMKESYAKFLSTTESFIDSQNGANQNAFQYHAIMSKLEDHQDISLLIQSKINKLSHLNIAHVFNELIDDILISGLCGIGTFIDVFILTIYDFCQNQRNILSSTVQALGAICAGLHKVFGIQYGSLFIETLIAYITASIHLLYNEYLQNYTKNFTLSKHGVIYLIPTDVKPIINLIDILGTMYMMSSVAAKFFFGFSDWLLNPSSSIYQLTSQTQEFLDSTAPTLSITSTSASIIPSTTSSSTSKLIQSLKAQKLHTTTQSTNTIDPFELQTNIQWTLQCTLLSHILIAFGLQLRKDDNSLSKTLFQSILDKSAGNEGSWHTQELILIVQDVRNNKQHIGYGDDAVSASKSKQPSNALSGSNITNIDYNSLREELFQAMNFILDNYNENLLEKSEEKKGRRETKKEQMKKQLDQMRQSQLNKTTISTKHLQKNTLNISFTDILRVKDTGRWWIVGAGFKQTSPNTVSENSTQDKAMRHLSMHDLHEDENNNNVDDDDDTLIKVSTKQLAQLAEQLQFHSPLQKFIFSTIMSSMDATNAYSAISSKHSNHSNSSHKNASSSISIAPSMYNEVMQTILTTCLNEPTYRSFYGDLLVKLLSTYSTYRFSCCTVIWDHISTLQNQFIEIEQALKVLKKAATGQKKALLEKKLTVTKQKSKELSKRTSNMAQLAADIITQPRTLDLYILKKMAFTPTMWGLLQDSENGNNNNDNNNNDNDNPKEQKDGKKAQNNPFALISTITSGDLNKMNDNVILFLHTLLTRICERLTMLSLSLTNDEIEQKIKDIIVPLQAPEITNYMSMDKDLVKWQFTTTSKYEKVKKQDKIIRENNDGKRILSCIIELLQTVVLPMLSLPSSTLSSDLSSQSTEITPSNVYAIAKLFSKLCKKNHITRK